MIVHSPRPATLADRRHALTLLTAARRGVAALMIREACFMARAARAQLPR